VAVASLALAVVLTAAARAEPPAGAASGCQDGAWPINVHIESSLRSDLNDLLLASALIRKQCQRLEQTPHVRVRVQLVTSPMGCHCFGKTTVAHFSDGAMSARVVLQAPASLFALGAMVAHEIEHVLEQVDGWNLRDLARRSRSGVRKVGPAMFETERAVAAGRAAVKELWTSASSRMPRTGRVNSD
jgi:hypothetical protein